MYVPRKRRGIFPIGCDNKSKTENSKIVRRVKNATEPSLLEARRLDLCIMEDFKDKVQCNS